MDGDQIIAFLGKCLKEEGKLRGNTVVATIVSNPALDRFLNGCGIQCVRSAVGERYVIEEMKNTEPMSAVRNPDIWFCLITAKPATP